MQIVINIPAEDYNQILNDREDAVVAHDACRQIAKGTILPDNHGRLIDADELKKSWVLLKEDGQIIDNAPTVLEASKE